MIGSTVTFTEAFKEKTSEKLTNKALGELRKKELIKADSDGRLMAAKTRWDVARIGGFDGEKRRVAGLGWVGRMVNQGLLSETLIGVSRDGVSEFEYHLKGLQPKDKPTSKPKEIEVVKEPAKVKLAMSLIHGDNEVRFDVEGVDVAFVTDIVKNMMNLRTVA